MTTTTLPAGPPALLRAGARGPEATAAGPSALTAWATLARRRLALSAHTPREVLAPLATPLLFALVLAPALARMIPAAGGLDYRTFVIIGTVGLLIPLACTFAGIGVIVDRTTGARREMLAAPISRGLIVAGNLVVAAGVSFLQVGVLLGAGLLRGSHFNATPTGIGWFVGGVLAFTVFMYALSEILANRIPTQEEYVGLTPVVAIVPWFLAGSLFPISALPVGLAWLTRMLPLTHALALLRYGLIDRHAAGLHDIWGMTNSTTEALLSMVVLVGWAGLLTVLAVRVFHRSAVS